MRANAGLYNLDPGRIGAVGVSAGGHPEQSSRVQALIPMAGVMDLSRSFPNADIEVMKRGGGKPDHACDVRRPTIFVDPRGAG